MAIDLVEKRRNIARQAIQLAPALMDVLYQLDALQKKRNKGGPGGTALVFADSDFTSQTGLVHLDAATMTTAFTAIPSILTAFANNDFDDAFEALRP